MKARYWWSAGIVVIAVVALMLLSVALPLSAVAAPVSPSGSSAAPSAPAASSAPSAASAPNTATPSTPSAAPASGSPHAGTLDIYEVAPGGATTEDPAVTYDTVSAEAVWNIYQVLVAYNGSSSATFVPELSTCVPGPSDGSSSAPALSCQAKYGNQLVKYDSAGDPIAFTYPIDSAARFYDPATGASWPVFPSDVMFTLSRTQAFANLPGVAEQPGWIQTQAIEQYGSPTWDGGIHYPFNNTPQGALSSILVNDSNYCPQSIQSATNGCVTFLANGGGSIWPFFNQLVADPMGAGITPCGWFTAQGASVPGFTGSSAAHGDGPCTLPGGATATNSSAFQNWLSTTPPTYWDSLEELAYNHPAINPNVQWNLVGSGPYYIAPGAFQQTVGYTLQASPAYHQPSSCPGVGGGCEPAVGNYMSKVVVLYESTDTEGIQEYVAGQADAATILPPETSTMLQLQSQGKIGVIYYPTISEFFLPYNFAWNTTTEPSIDPVGTINVGSTFFANSAVRNLLDHSWPYTTIQNTLWTIDGVKYAFNFGGTIPVGMGNYYPTNISWPYLGGDPCTGSTQSTCNSSVNSALWWWQQGTTSGSPYYDAALAACTASSPCKFPIIGQQGAPTLDSAIADFISQVKIVTGGAIQMYTFDMTFHDLVVNSLSNAYQNPMPFFNLGWAPDYPDPTDYAAAMYYANATYTEADSLYQVLVQKNPVAYNAASCGHDSGSFADLSYWANYLEQQSKPFPSSCSGIAYSAMLTWMATAAALPVGSYRVLLYNMIEHVENQLGLYVWYEQNNGIGTYAKWINNQTFNTNVMIGGGNDQTWYSWGYENAVSTVYFNETGLSSGTSWTVNFAGTPYTSTGASIAVSGVTSGSYAWSVDYINGYTVDVVNGTITTTAPTPSAQGLTFTGYSGGATLSFQEIGLASGVAWTSIIAGVGAISSNNTVHTYTIPAATYTYYTGIQVGYSVSPNNGTGSVVLGASGATVTVMFTGLLLPTFSVTFMPLGLSGTDTWSVSLGKFTNSSTTGGSITFWQSDGSYSFTLTGPSGVTPIATKGLATVADMNQTIEVPFMTSPTPAVFKETGLVGGPQWGVTITTYTGSGVTGYNFTVASTGTSLSFNLNATPGAKYNYSVYPMSGWKPAPMAGHATVNATTSLIKNTTIAFSLVTYHVTIYEVGLPPLIGTAPPKWGVNASFTYPGTSTTGYAVKSSTATTITLSLPNGSASIAVSGPAGYTAAGTSVVVAAGAGSAVVVFSIVPFTYQVTFTPSGLSGTWTVYFNGVVKNGTGALSFTASNGTYTYAVSVPSGQVASPSGGSLTVNGAGQAVSVSVKGAPSSSTSVPSWVWAVIGLFVVLTVIFLITTLMARRKPPTPPAPQSWQPGQGGEGGSSPPPST